MSDIKITEEEIQYIFSTRLEKAKDDEAWIILFDNQRYKTKKGKSLWKKKNHASSAFRNDTEYECKYFIKHKLNLPKYQEYKSIEYKHAFENFRDELISNGRLKIVNINKKENE